MLQKIEYNWKTRKTSKEKLNTEKSLKLRKKLKTALRNLRNTKCVYVPGNLSRNF